LFNDLLPLSHLRGQLVVPLLLCCSQLFDDLLPLPHLRGQLVVPILLCCSHCTHFGSQLEFGLHPPCNLGLLCFLCGSQLISCGRQGLVGFLHLGGQAFLCVRQLLVGFLPLGGQPLVGFLLLGDEGFFV
ncbi:unnamed protein product, partial [Ectocarpus fasciculatus]